MSIIDAFVVGTFGLWLLFTVLVNIRSLTFPIRRYDPLGVLPQWRFFAPVPMQFDYHLLYRDFYSDGEHSDWTEVHIIQPRSFRDVIWNPEKRRKKALLDVLTRLAQHIVASDKAILVSLPYLSVLNYISSIPRDTTPVGTQFLVMKSFGEHSVDPYQVLFLSGLHSLDSSTAPNVMSRQ
jgi:hypothetical protein